jgi:DNA-binding SARP family transcriptional activator
VTVVAAVEIRLLGGVSAYVNREPIHLGGPQQHRLLAALAIAEAKPLSMVAIGSILWPSGPEPNGADRAILSYISRLRAALGVDCISRSAFGYTLVPNTLLVDASEFERRYATITSSTANQISQTVRLHELDEVLSSWHGKPLGLYSEEPWARSFCDRLNEVYLSCVEDRFECLNLLGRRRESIGPLGQAFAEHPSRSRFGELLMRSLVAEGRQAEALRAYQVHRRELAELTGLDPAPALIELERAIVADRALPPSRTLRSNDSLPQALQLDESRLPFVGRTEELATLCDRWKATQSGQSCVVCITGEAGIGKSRLVAEFAQIVKSQGVGSEGVTSQTPVLFGRCDEELQSSYLPFVEALRTDLVNPATAGVSLREMAGVNQRYPTTDASEDELRLFDAALAMLIRDRTIDVPVLLILEDLQWADSDSLRLLRYLIQHVGTEVCRTQAMIVCTYRDSEITANHPLQRFLGILRQPKVHMPLLGLNTEAIDQLINSVDTPRNESVVGSATDLRERTGGNPFFVSALLTAQNDRLTVNGQVTEPLPLTVREVVRSRVSHIDKYAFDVLESAATIGTDFEIDILLRLLYDVPEANLSQRSVVKILETASRSGLLIETAVDHWRFAHALVRDALLIDVSQSRRVRMHRDISNALAELRPSDAAARAFHLDRSGANARRDAYEQFCIWGQRAVTSQSNAEACSALERAVELLTVLEPENLMERAELSVMLATAYARVADSRWRKIALDAAALAEHCGRQDLQVPDLIVLTRIGFAPSVMLSNASTRTTFDYELC